MNNKKFELLPAVISIVLVGIVGLGPLMLVSSSKISLEEARIRIVGELDRSYSGRYSADPRLQDMLNRLAELKQRSLIRVEQKTGFIVDDSDKFVIRFVDTGTGTDRGASIRPVLLDGEKVNLIDLSADQFVLGVMDVHASLVHEFIHGVMRELMGNQRYYALDKRIREGIAIWGAGQLRERCNNIVAAAFYDGKDQKTLIRELGLVSSPLDDYLMDALLFEYVNMNHGHEAVKDLLSRIMAGQDYITSLETVTGFSFEQLSERHASFANMYLEGVIFESGLDIFTNARRRVTDGDIQGAITLLSDLAEGPFDTLLKPSAWYWLGRLYFEQGDFGEASEAFAIILECFPFHRGLCDSSRLWLAEAGSYLDNRERELLANHQPLIPTPSSALVY